MSNCASTCSRSHSTWPCCCANAATCRWWSRSGRRTRVASRRCRPTSGSRCCCAPPSLARSMSTWSGTPPALRRCPRCARPARVVVVSRHDFSAMPPDLADGWWPALAALGPDVVKVVGTASDVRDCLPVFRALSGDRANVPTIAIAMGEPGSAHARPGAARRAVFSDVRDARPGQLHRARAAYGARDARDVSRRAPATEHAGLRSARSTRRGPRLSRIQRLVRAGQLGRRERAVQGRRPMRRASSRRSASCPSAAGTSTAPTCKPGLQALDDLAPTAAKHNKVNGIVRRQDGGLVGHWVESPREQYEVWRSED